jgi:kynurenine formamidase
VKRYVDLTGKLENGLWSYRDLPGLDTIVPDVSIETIATVKKNEFFASRITVASISGTYLEAGSHILEDGKTLDEYGVEDFIKPATLIRLPKQAGKAMIGADLLETHAPANIPRGRALIVETGWWSRWNTPGFVLESPNFDRGAVQWLLDREPAICGFDITCLESSWSEDVVEEKGGLLGMIFRQAALLLAPLVNLGQLRGTEGTLYCLPLHAAGTSGAPVRVVFEEQG